MAELVQATKREIPLILKYMESFYVLDNYPFDRHRSEVNLNQFISTPHLGRLWLVYHEKEPVGYIALTFGYSFEYGGRDAFIDEFFLIETVRNQGIGSAVMKMLDEKAKSLGVSAVHLEVEPHNEKGNRIYQKAGFKGNGRTLLTKKLV